jgi:hypothetical protein
MGIIVILLSYVSESSPLNFIIYEILESAQVKFYRTRAVSVLNYSCENWTTNHSEKINIHSTEMGFLRSVTAFTHANNKI